MPDDRQSTHHTTRRELDVLSFDMQEMKRQALVITERILGTSHKDTIFRYTSSTTCWRTK
jgi:hypothetical protein